MKTTLIKIGRWIAVLPAFIIAYMLAKFLSATGGEFFFSDNISEVQESGTLEGNWVSGIIYLTFREYISLLSAFVAGVYVAPSYKRETFFVLITAFVTTLAITIIFLGGKIFARNDWGHKGALLCEVIGWIIAVISSFALLKDIKENRV